MASPNVTVFNFNTVFNIPNGTIDLSDASVYTNVGAVLGIDFAVYIGGSASGILVYQNTSWVTPDILPDAPTTKSVTLPTFGNAVQWGTYTIVGTINDGAGNIWSVTNTFNLCQPDQCDCDCGCNNGSGACANLTIKFDCRQSTVYVWDTTDFTYQGVQGTPTYGLTITRPNNTVATSSNNVWSDSPVIDGQYQVVAADSATYSFPNNTTVIIDYNSTQIRIADCTMCLCNLYCAIAEYDKEYCKVKGTGSQRERTIESSIVELTMLLFQAQAAIECGYDTSDIVKRINAIVGTSCTCNCNTSIPQQGASSLYNVIVQAGGGDISVAQSVSGSYYYFTVSDVTYIVQPLAGQTGITITSTTGSHSKTYNIAISPDNLKIVNDYSIYVINPATYAEGSTDVPIGSPLSTVINTINTSLHEINLAIHNITVTPVWNTLTLAAGWSNFSGTAQYSKDIFGFVHLKGYIQKINPTAPDLITTFPSGYRIDEISEYSPFLSIGGTYSSVAAVSIDTDGTLKLVGNTTTPTTTMTIIFIKTAYHVLIIG